MPPSERNCNHGSYTARWPDAQGRSQCQFEKAESTRERLRARARLRGRTAGHGGGSGGGSSGTPPAQNVTRGKSTRPIPRVSLLAAEGPERHAGCLRAGRPAGCGDGRQGARPHPGGPICLFCPISVTSRLIPGTHDGAARLRSCRRAGARRHGGGAWRCVVWRSSGHGLLERRTPNPPIRCPTRCASSKRCNSRGLSARRSRRRGPGRAEPHSVQPSYRDSRTRCSSPRSITFPS